MEKRVASTDAFGGNSGSGVFNAATREMVGILVSGQKDYDENGCPVEYPQGEGGETVSGAMTLLPYNHAVQKPPSPP